MIKNRLMKKIAIFVCIVSMFTNIALAETGFSVVEEVNSSIILLSENSVKGQVNVESIKGNTRTNKIKNGNGENNNNDWLISNASITWDDSNKYFVLEGTAQYGYIYQVIDVEPNTDYVVKLSGEIDTTEKFFITVRNELNTTNIAQISSTNTSFEEKVISFNSGSESKVRLQLQIGTTLGKANFRYILMEKGTVAGNYINGTKSTASAKLVSCAKNLGDFLNNTEWENGDFAGNNNNGSFYIQDNKIHLDGDGSGNSLRHIRISLDSSKTYTITFDKTIKTGTFFRVRVADNNELLSGGSDISSGHTISNREYVNIEIQTQGTDSGYIENLMIRDNTTDETYEPYKGSISYIALPEGEELRSLPNGVYDEISDSKLIKRIKEYVLQSVDITNYDTTASNLDLVVFDKPTDFIGYGVSTGITGNVTSDIGIGSPTYVNDASYIGQIMTFGSLKFAYGVEKGTYTDLAAAQADLAGTTLIYQLATEQTTDIPTTPLIGYPNGTIIIEPAVSEGGIYDGSITINNSDLPIESIENVKRINNDSTRTMIDLSNITIASDGKSFTITGAADGESYEYEYMYPQELTTIPTISYSVPIDQNGQISGNTNMIQQNSELIDLILQEIELLRDEINTME